MSLTMYCPFLTTDYKGKAGVPCIRCERATLKFASDEEWKEFACKYCASINGWQKCSIAESTMRHYERIDGTNEKTTNC